MRVPGELQRFAQLPMKVEYVAEGDKVRHQCVGLLQLRHCSLSLSSQLLQSPVSLPYKAAATNSTAAHVIAGQHAPQQRSTHLSSSAPLLFLNHAQVDTKVLNFSEYDAASGLTRWKLADVRANRNQAGKGRGLNRKQRDAVYELPLAAVRRVNLYLDF